MKRCEAQAAIVRFARETHKKKISECKFDEIKKKLVYNMLSRPLFESCIHARTSIQLLSLQN
jgi:hypothetical protein